MESKVVKLDNEQTWDGKYPAIFEWASWSEEDGRDLIVLFTAERRGTVLVANEVEREVGETTDELIPCINTMSWRWLPPREIVTLNN